jgi:16S rRNA C967 or C1407 C5-methylase (RsmB/RsmF family)
VRAARVTLYTPLALSAEPLSPSPHHPYPCSRGFQLLRPGGVLVYSTCSLTAAQNEDVVRWLLETCDGEARLLPIAPEEITRSAAARRAAVGAAAEAPGARGAPAADASAVLEAAMPVPPPSGTEPDPLHLRIHSLRSVPCEPGSIPGTIRFSPLQSGGVGGLFIARLTKVTRP